MLTASLAAHSYQQTSLRCGQATEARDSRADTEIGRGSIDRAVYGEPATAEPAQSVL
jgi:hypothetical protein